MDLVVDANILFAALIKESVSYHLLFRDDLHLFSPEYILEEFEKHKLEILEKTESSLEEFKKVVDILRRRITLIPLEELAPYVHKAALISPDPKDVAYLALALKLHCPVWSNDKKLKEKQTIIPVYSTTELMKF